MVDFDETASRLRAETSGLVKAFRDRAQKVRGAKELLLLIKPLDEQLATRTALELFGESQHRAVGIDGSMMTDELLEMIVFYANACAFGCSFEVTRSGIEFALDTAARDSRLDVSCTVPLWIEDIPSIVSSSNGEGDYGIDAVSDKLPFAVMAMAELMTADRVLDEGSARILFMDRPISGTYGPLARDYRELLRRSKTSLEGWQTPYGELTKLDMALAYHLHDGTLRVPRRRRHLFCHALKRLLDGEKTSYESLSKKMKLDNGGLMAVKRMLRRIGGDDDLLETGMKEGDTHLKMTDEARDYWKRVSFVKEALLAKVFGGDGHPLQLDQGTWVNSLELNSMNVILLREVIRKSIENRVLLVGIAKDTLATEFGRTVVPYSGSTSSTSSEKSPWSMRSDKSLLSIFSTSDELDIPTPWRTIGYDGAFSTLVAVDPK